MSGYIHCSCGTCFETTIGEPGALCSDCEEAGCEPGQECRVLPEPEPDRSGWTSPAQEADRKAQVGQFAIPLGNALQDLGRALLEGKAKALQVVVNPDGTFTADIQFSGETLYLPPEGEPVIVLGDTFTIEVKP